MASVVREPTERNSRLSVDYEQLNALSSVTLFDSAPRRKRGRFYEVERIITRRDIRHGHEYLLKWKGWSFQYCSWEPSQNLTPDLLMSYLTPPKPATTRLEVVTRDFLNSVQAGLKGKSVSAVLINMDLDVWRYITANQGIASEHRGYTLYEKEDFWKFQMLPSDWYYYLNEHGEGGAIDFPVKAKPIVS